MRVLMTALVACALATAVAVPVTASVLRSDSSRAHDDALNGLTSVYASLADSILANKRIESAVVRAIVEMERGMALSALERARADAAAMREVADRIAGFATEGGAAVEPIRNRLLEGGHHHHADDSGPDAAYDSGYVILDKKAKRSALDLAKRCAKLAQSDAVSDTEIAEIRTELLRIAPATGR
ncbi:MAG: hypothetical protein KDC38_04155 [Planctomycetes bacterium]|nr:hypothetical protein [Planctomycetota bacterium]